MKNILLLLLLTIAAMGQSLGDQKACYNQAKKKAHYFTNHFDGKTCWVLEVSNTTSSPVIYERYVSNAFANDPAEAMFQGALGKKPLVCIVGDQECISIDRFDELVAKRYGLK